MKKYSFLLIILGFFYTLAIVLWLSLNEIFYLYNFIIIGTCLGVGVGLWPVLPKHKKHIARMISQIAVGGYMFFGLGCGFIYLMFNRIMPENMQIEGFWFWLLSGAFMAAVIHFSVAKIVGPLIFNRAWCGWTCWTAAIFDLLPWKTSPGRLAKKYGYLRYIHFIVSAILVFILFFTYDYGLKNTVRAVIVDKDTQLAEGIFSMIKIPELWWFLVGNLLYYTVGIILAMILKDNRAFCKYICPIVVFMKIGSRFSMIKVKKTLDNCTNCKLCEKKCPMDIEITKYIRENKRVSSSECIICHTCISTCPQKTLKLSFGFDAGNEYLRNKSAKK